MISARILADSVNPDGARLTTLEVVMPRFVLAEFNTHRAFSRNSASSRAIPVAKQIARIETDPFVPEQFPINRPGMSATDYVYKSDDRYQGLVNTWLEARDCAVGQAQILLEANVHKQIATRLLEPFMWHTVIVSATDWDNFFKLRISEFAQPEIRDVAVAVKREMVISENEKLWTELDWGEWHLPMIGEHDDADTSIKPDMWAKISAGRCARVSYLTHDGVRDPVQDLLLFDRLSGNGHLSPLEHPARACNHPYGEQVATHGNFRGWHQLRKDYE